MTSKVVRVTPKVVRVTVYMSPELKEKIKQLSFDGPDASLNKKVVFILEQYFEKESVIKHPVKLNSNLDNYGWRDE